MNETKECPSCHGYGEIMHRERLIDSDGSEDIGATPEVRVCSRCNGEGKIEKPKRLLKEELEKIIIRLKKEGKI